jgi:bifunctional oligoribonuclease and PAP phosphatase NrnA
MTYKFSKEFNQIRKELEKAQKILLIAHPRPDWDTAGSVFVLKEYLWEKMGKKADVACVDPLNEHLAKFFEGEKFFGPQEIEACDYDLVIGCDAVERGVEKIVSEKKRGQKIILIDHHPTVEMKKIDPDIVVADENASSVCEMLFDFFDFHRIEITRKMATYMLAGILYDTAVFQHANTNARVMEVAAGLMRKGAPMNKIVQAIFKDKKIETLKLWGRAMERAEINPNTGAIISFITQEDMNEFGMEEDGVGRIAELLNTVSGTKFSLVLIEKEENKVKGSLRSEWYKNVDVSEIARKFRGGGHKLASGFEIEGKIVRDKNGIAVE